MSEIPKAVEKPIDSVSKLTGDAIGTAAGAVPVVGKPLEKEVKKVQQEHPIIWLAFVIIIVYLIYKNWTTIRGYLVTWFNSAKTYLSNLGTSAKVLPPSQPTNSNPPIGAGQSTMAAVYATSGSAQVPTVAPQVASPTAAPISSGHDTPRPVVKVVNDSVPTQTQLTHTKSSPYEKRPVQRRPDPDSRSIA